MHQPIISFNAKNAAGYHPSIIFHSYINRSTDNQGMYSPMMPGIWRYHQCPVACALAQELRIALGHIRLSVEMLESLIDDDDLEMYLDVISRNSARIDTFVKNFLISSPQEQGNHHMQSLGNDFFRLML